MILKTGFRVRTIPPESACASSAGRPTASFRLFPAVRTQTATPDKTKPQEIIVNNPANRRHFLKTAALASAAVTLPRPLAFPSSKSLLVFTKSSGFEHSVVKRNDGQLSIAETKVTELGTKHTCQVQRPNNGRI